MYRNKTYHDDVIIEKHDTPFKGYFSIERYQLQFRKFSGEWSESITREVFERGSAITVIPYDPKKDAVLLIEQFRAGAMSDTKSPWLLEVIAGIIDEGETKEEVAYRESEEEAGLALQKLIPIHHFYATPGGSTEEVTLFCGISDLKENQEIFGLKTESEDIKTHLFSFDKAYELMEKGEINNAPAIIGLQWLKLNRTKL